MNFSACFKYSIQYSYNTVYSTVPSWLATTVLSLIHLLSAATWKTGQFFYWGPYLLFLRIEDWHVLSLRIAPSLKLRMCRLGFEWQKWGSRTEDLPRFHAVRIICEDFQLVMWGFKNYLWGLRGQISVVWSPLFWHGRLLVNPELANTIFWFVLAIYLQVISCRRFYMY